MNHSVRTIIYIISLFLIIILSGIIAELYLGNSARELCQYLDKAEEYTISSKWELAKNELHVMEIKWDKTKKIWAVLTDHSEIDSISISLSKAIKYVEEKEKPSSLAEISVLKELILHVPDKELPVLDNIF